VPPRSYAVKMKHFALDATRSGAIDFYTVWNSVYIDYSDKLLKAQIDEN